MADNQCSIRQKLQICLPPKCEAVFVAVRARVPIGSKVENGLLFNWQKRARARREKRQHFDRIIGEQERAGNIFFDC